ncbi:MAG: hypothetical protein ACRD1P_02220 [Thermoanaerobaculia bacterium]
MPEARVDAFRAARTFDPVCGGPVFDPDRANQFFDGKRTHYFCCAMCRRIFIDEWQALGGARACRQVTVCSANSLRTVP